MTRIYSFSIITEYIKRRLKYHMIKCHTKHFFQSRPGLLFHFKVFIQIYLAFERATAGEISPLPYITPLVTPV